MFDLHIENMVSDKGNNIPNQFIIYYGFRKYFQSYKTIICRIDTVPKKNDVIILDNNWSKYSKTTSKYLYRFLGMNKSAIISGIKDETIKLECLNQ